ncbi:response regulator [Spirulina sp. CS-785/01]|uniref:response regulator transcription factor n=1 Tax=Spirulina sp. CS-785/01 TaxID=3021716 RepID=UPI00233077C5|nr:response regulator [Spirulina sp. CS-785/01]MDB9312137.1 response regulator [Spirulina sp. CS-785/01]
MKRVLVVDDDKTLREVLQEYLENAGYQVEGVSSGTEGLTAFEQNPPDIIVSDVMMPEMNGLDFCRTLRSTPSGQLVPFIFLSGKNELEDRVKGHEMGADDYVTKPFAMRELLAKIETQLERSRRIHSEIVRMMQQMTGSRRGESQLGGEETAQKEEAKPPEPLPLTPAEERVFWEVIQGYTNKQISDRLFISPRTVQSHLSNILGKLQLDNRAQLVRFAYEQGYRSPHKED